MWLIYPFYTQNIFGCTGFSPHQRINCNWDKSLTECPANDKIRMTCRHIWGCSPGFFTAVNKYLLEGLSATCGKFSLKFYPGRYTMRRMHASWWDRRNPVLKVVLREPQATFSTIGYLPGTYCNPIKFRKKIGVRRSTVLGPLNWIYCNIIFLKQILNKFQLLNNTK